MTLRGWLEKQLEKYSDHLKDWVNENAGVTWGKISNMPESPTIIRLNQTISDPYSMLSGEFGKDGDPKTNVISWIRANSHRYVGNYDAEQGMVLKQLDDSNSELYADGSDASEDIKGTNGGDVFMKMPDFWFKGVEVDGNPDIVDILFSIVEPTDEGWTKWDGNTLIGAYEAVAENTSNNTTGGLFSRSNSTPTGNVTQVNFKAKARNRSNGDDHFMLVTYEAHQAMALLYLTYYGNMNGREVIGAGTSSNPKVAGQTNVDGMNDTVVENKRSINFWGLENWWGDIYEWMDNLVTADGSGTVNVNNYDGETDRQVKGYASSRGNYITKMVLGEKLDLILSALGGGSQRTYYCDWGTVYNSAGQVGIRSGDSNSPYAGPFCLCVEYPSSTWKAGSLGSRLLYHGRVVVES